MDSRSLGRAVGVVVALAVAIPSAAPADTEFRAQFLCNDRGTVYPIVGANVALMKRDDGVRYLWGGTPVRLLQTDHDGRVSTSVGGPETNFFFNLDLANERLELSNWYSRGGRPGLRSFATFTHQNDVPVQDYGAQVLGDARRPPDCAIWEGLRQAFDNYVATAPPERPPEWGTKWTVKVTAPTRYGAPFAHQDVIDWPPDYPPGSEPGTFTAMFREFGKTVLHGLQTEGDDGHLNAHTATFGDFDAPDRPCRRTNIGHAFNDGWGEWWANAYGPAPNCPRTRPDDYAVAGNVAAALAELERLCPGGRRGMIEAFEWFAPNAPHIHEFRGFERAFGCFPGPLAPLEARREDISASGAQVVDFIQRQRASLRAAARERRARLPDAVDGSLRASDCDDPPCTAALDTVTLPFVLRAEIRQATLLRRTLSFGASLRGLRRAGGSSPTQWLRRMNRRSRTFGRRAARIGEQEISRAINAVGEILRRDQTEQTQLAGEQLRALRRTFRRGRLPQGFLLQPASLQLQTAPGPAPPPPSGEPPPSGASPDLVVDAIEGLRTHGGSEPLVLKVTVRNAGTAGAPASKLLVTMRRSTDNAQSTRELDVPALAPGASTTVETTCEPYGVDSATATADSASAIAEGDESNNTRSATGTQCRYN